MSANFSFATAKVVNYFGLSKKKSDFERFLFRNGKVNHFRNRVNLFRILVNFFRRQYSNTSYNWR